MRVLVLSGLLIAWMASARSFAAEVLVEDPLSSLGAWQAKPQEAVSVDNGAAKIVARNSSPHLSQSLDAKAMAGRKIVFSVEAKGQNIQTGREVYCCGKIQVVYLKANCDSEKRVFDLDEPMLKVSTFQGDCEVPPYSISRILLHFED